MRKIVLLLVVSLAVLAFGGVAFAERGGSVELTSVRGQTR